MNDLVTILLYLLSTFALGYLLAVSHPSRAMTVLRFRNHRLVIIETFYREGSRGTSWAIELLKLGRRAFLVVGVVRGKLYLSLVGVRIVWGRRLWRERRVI